MSPALQSIGDIIQALALPRGRGDASPLLLSREFDSVPGERISHLPVDAELAQAWTAMTGDPFRPHQAQALMALRRGEPVALCAASADVAMTALLLLYATLLPDPGAAALVLAADEAHARRLHARLSALNRELPQQLRLAPALVEAERRPDYRDRVLIATPEALHWRLLRHHDRAWRPFWSRARLVFLPEAHGCMGVAGAHLADLLIRMHRIIATHGDGHVPGVVATLIALENPEPALANLLGQPWRIVPADDGPRRATLLAVWRGAGGRLRESIELAVALQRHGYQVHIHCEPLVAAAIAPLIGDLPAISIGPDLPSVQVLIVAGYPGSHSMLRRMLRSGYEAVALVLGDLPHEQALARHPEALMTDPPAAWPAPTPNAYVTALHLLCAASEQPLTEAEVESWSAQEMVARLVASGQLVDLPDPEVAWKPTEAAGDPYVEFSLLASSGGAIVARSEQARTLAALDPTGFERWAFVGAALPPGVGGFRVVARDEETGSITLRLESNGRRTYPLRRCEVSVRDERAARALPSGKQIGWGRVVVNEETYGYREATPGGNVAENTLTAPLAARWIAPACWFDVGVAVQAAGQFVGWCLAMALPLRALASFTNIVPCYDRDQRRLYLIDAQPGGSGLAQWIYSHAEALLPLAYDIALACRNDALLEPLCRADMDWLLALLGRAEADAVVREQRRAEALPAPLPAQSPGEEARPPAQLVLSVPPPEPDPPRHEGPPAHLPPETPERRPEPRAAIERAPRERYTPRQDERPPHRSARRDPPADRPSARVAPEPPPPRADPEPPPPRGRPADDEPPDPTALIERLRRQRQQREAGQGPPARGVGRSWPEAPAARVEPRFAVGERVVCLPYGEGVVRAVRVEEGREVLVVAFPDHGELTIDPAISLVRKVEARRVDEDDLL